MIRFIDLVILIIFLPAYLPVLVIASILKLLIDGRPVFYVSERCVKGFAKVKIYKFRTMVNDRSVVEKEVLKYTRSGFESIPIHSIAYTAFGRMYERFQLVELPQLLNILLGHLSFVGNRPLPEKNVKILVDQFGSAVILERHKHRAGLTGYCQLVGKLNLSSEERLRLEISLNRDLYEKGVVGSIILYISLIVDTLSLVIANRSLLLDRRSLSGK